MLLAKNRLLDIPIMSLQTGAQIASTSEPITDPRKLNIIAFYCDGPNIGFSPAILHISDIRELGSLGIIIDDADSIMPPDDLVRLQEILDFKFQLEGKPVVDDKGTKLGKVDSYSVDPNSFYIIKLHIKPTLLRSFSFAELLIDRTQIITINDKQIIVKSPAIKSAKSKLTLSPTPIENPFKSAKPQSQATDHQTK